MIPKFDKFMIFKIGKFYDFQKWHALLNPKIDKIKLRQVKISETRFGKLYS